jgi:hypothetical protein
MEKAKTEKESKEKATATLEGRESNGVDGAVGNLNKDISILRIHSDVDNTGVMTWRRRNLKRRKRERLGEGETRENGRDFSSSDGDEMSRTGIGTGEVTGRGSKREKRHFRRTIDMRVVKEILKGMTVMESEKKEKRKKGLKKRKEKRKGRDFPKHSAIPFGKSHKRL